MNTFEQAHIDGLNRTLGTSGAVARRSMVYTKSAVIGRPGVPGAIIVCMVEEDPGCDPDGHGRPHWLVHHFEGTDPKSVSDGMVDWNLGEEHRFWHWADLRTFVTKVFH